VLVATHNLMHGVRLPRLIERYLALQRDVGLDILCVQENTRTGGRTHSARIAAALGPRFAQVAEPDRTDTGILYDNECFRLVDAQRIALPRLTELNWLERRYIASGRPEQKYAQLAVLEPTNAAPFVVVSFHLETAGTNQHRRAQIGAIAAALTDRGATERAVICGDTNAFVLRARQQPAAMRALLAPLWSRGFGDLAAGADLEDRATHFFARQHEPRLTHRLTVLLGKLGLDLPLRYDVICSDLPARGCGVASAPESDHDIVWAALSVA
jgi:endonuclease/exonuclease/phosphatase family metal-dependent hydrolase